MGLSREEDDGHWYAFTDLEATHARNVFPFVRRALVQGAVRGERDGAARHDAPTGTARKLEHADDPDARGKTTTFTFAPTPPLPSYLVRGRGGRSRRTSRPLRRQRRRCRCASSRPRARGSSVRVSLEDGPSPLVRSRSATTSASAIPTASSIWSPCPTSRAGAMENPGLITFREMLPAGRPEARSATSVRRLQEPGHRARAGPPVVRRSGDARLVERQPG